MLTVVLTVAALAVPSAAGTIAGAVTARGLRHAGDIVVYIEGPGPRPPYAPLERHAVMDQIALAFTPPILPILRGTTVDFPNSDEVRHNVFTPSEIAGKFNLGTYPKGVVKSVTFNRAGMVPVLCNVHAEMEGWIVVLENPHYTVTARDGTFLLADVPPGEYTLSAWHPRLRPERQRVVVPGEGEVRASFPMRRQ